MYIRIKGVTLGQQITLSRATTTREKQAYKPWDQ